MPVRLSSLLRSFVLITVPLAIVGTCSTLTAADDKSVAAPADVKLPFTATLVLTHDFCESVLQVEGTRLDSFGFGHFACRDLEPALKPFFSNLSAVQTTPTSGSAQIVLQPELKEPTAWTDRKVFSVGKDGPVTLQWTVKDQSGKVIWIGTVQARPQRKFGLSAIAGYHTLQDVVKDLAAQSGHAIASAPEMQRFVELFLAKSSVPTSPAAVAASANFFRAIQSDDVAQIADLLKDNPRLASAPNPNADTPLHLAASSGNKSLVELLLASHADVNAKDANGATPLHNAAFAGHKDVAELLLANKADAGAADFKGSTPLHKAAEQGYTEIVNLLLLNHADANAKDSARTTPLLLAASTGHKDVVESLLDGHVEIVRMLLDAHADVNAKDNGGITPLHLVAQDGGKEMIALLLDSKADVNAKDAKGNTPLLFATRAGHSDAVALLLASHADVNSKGPNGETALSLAASQGSKELVALLLANNADVNWRDAGGATPLHVAAKQGSSDVVKMLLAHNAEVNAQSAAGATPLHNAVSNGHQDAADLLRTRGGLDFAVFAWPETESIGPPHKIALLPVVDSRADTRDKVDLENLRKIARKELEKKRYDVVEADAAPAGERWAITVSLVSTGGRGVYSAATISCVLKDQQTGLVQWRGGAGGAWGGWGGWFSPGPGGQGPQYGGLQQAAAASAQQTTGILLAALMPGSARKDAVDNAVRTALQYIPDLKPKKQKK